MIDISSTSIEIIISIAIDVVRTFRFRIEVHVHTYQLAWSSSGTINGVGALHAAPGSVVPAERAQRAGTATMGLREVGV